MAKVLLHKGDIFEHVFVDEPSLDLHIVQEAGSRVKIHVLNFASAKNNISIEQQGEGCETEIYALANLSGDEQVVTETHVNHAVGGGRSNQLIKFVLDERAKGHYVGELKIAPDAQQVDAHQTNRNILLSDDAEMRTQPQLEIYADDVQATHGASTGQLDESALFYMQQRGIGKKKARQLLVNAFMKEVLDTISDINSLPFREGSGLGSLLHSIDGVVE